MLRLILPLILLLLPLATRSADSVDADPLRIGIFPRHPAEETRKMFQPLADYLERRLGVAVELETPADYPAFWAGVEERRFDLVHYNQYHYVRAHREFGHQLVGANEEHARNELRATVFVHRDSPYRTLSDLKGQKILFGGGPKAMVSYILATDLLRQHGLRNGDYLENFAQNPIKAVLALYYRQSDAAVAGDLALEQPSLSGRLPPTALRVLGQSMPIAHLPWAVEGQVGDAQRNTIRRALLELIRSEDGRRILAGMQMTAIRRAEDRQYDSVREVIQRVLGERY